MYYNLILTIKDLKIFRFNTIKYENIKSNNLNALRQNSFARTKPFCSIHVIKHDETWMKKWMNLQIQNFFLIEKNNNKESHIIEQDIKRYKIYFYNKLKQHR